MVGMDMGVERPGEAKAERLNDGEVAPHRLEHRIDQHGGARVGTGEQIGEARRFRLEKLAEDHSGDPSRQGGERARPAAVASFRRTAAEASVAP
jgi:hypothetical protein